MSDACVRGRPEVQVLFAQEHQSQFNGLPDKQAQPMQSTSSRTGLCRFGQALAVKVQDGERRKAGH
jgi:hypothetical protein